MQIRHLQQSMTPVPLRVGAAGKRQERCHFVSLPVTLMDTSTPVVGPGDKIHEDPSAVVRFSRRWLSILGWFMFARPTLMVDIMTWLAKPALLLQNK